MKKNDLSHRALEHSGALTKLQLTIAQKQGGRQLSYFTKFHWLLNRNQHTGNGDCVDGGSVGGCYGSFIEGAGNEVPAFIIPVGTPLLVGQGPSTESKHCTSQAVEQSN